MSPFPDFISVDLLKEEHRGCLHSQGLHREAPFHPARPPLQTPAPQFRLAASSGHRTPTKYRRFQHSGGEVQAFNCSVTNYTLSSLSGHPFVIRTKYIPRYPD